jgi:hypothetical protein
LRRPRWNNQDAHRPLSLELRQEFGDEIEGRIGVSPLLPKILQKRIRLLLLLDPVTKNRNEEAAC